jgi:hypothetical protein
MFLKSEPYIIEWQNPNDYSLHGVSGLMFWQYHQDEKNSPTALLLVLLYNARNYAVVQSSETEMTQVKIE